MGVASDVIRQARAGTAGVNVLTVASVGALAYIAVAIVHEAAGHGSACALLGGSVLAVSSTELRCEDVDGDLFPIVAAAGSVANVVTGLAVLLTAMHRPPRDPVLRLLAWVFGSLSIYHAGSYLAVGAIFGFGDWSTVARVLGGGFVGPLIVGAIGAGAIIAGNRLAADGAWQPLVGAGQDERTERWPLITWPALGAAMIVSLGAGLLSPLRPEFALVTSVAAPLTLLWLARLPAWPRRDDPSPALTIAARPAWWIAAVLVGAAFVALLGPGIGSFAGYSIAR